MNKEFHTLIVPIFKGFYITVIVVIAALALAAKMVIYSVPEYQTSGSIKIDDRNINLGDLALFEEAGRTKGATSVDFLTEVEMFRSDRLKELAFKKLNFDIDYFRVGKIKTVDLYKDHPIDIAYRVNNEKGFDKLFYVKYLDDDQLIWSTSENVFPSKNSFRINHPVKLDEVNFMVKKNKKFLAGKPQSLRAGDVFAFRINSIQGLVKSVNESNFFIRSVDKNVQIIDLFYQHEVPEKAALFINALMESYIEDCKNTHREEADKALEFIDEQLANVKKKLKRSEGLLVRYKTQKSIMNIKQETDATLKEMMQLEFQKVQYDMQEAELKRTFEFLASGNDLRDFAPNFEALKDIIFRETFIRAQKLELERQDLLVEYTPTSDQVRNAESKINSMRTFLHESVKNALANMAVRRNEMEETIADISQSVKEYPDKEQRTMVLQREVKLNEELYTSLIEKRMEIAVAKNANTVFHQIVDRAKLNTLSISPNKPLFYGVALFFGLLIGIALSFLKHFFTAKIRSKEDLVQLFAAPIIGSIPQIIKGDNPINALGNLYTNLELLQSENNVDGKANTFLISSMLPEEGKTFTTVNLAKVYASMGKKILVIDMDVQSSELHDRVGIKNERGLSSLLRNEISPYQAVVKTNLQNLDAIPSGNIEDIFSGILFAPQTTSFIETLKEDYDIILIDAPAVGMVENVTLMMQQVNYNLMVFRAKKTKIQTVKLAQKKFEEYEVPNVYSVFNGEKRKKLNGSFNTIANSRKVWDMVMSSF